MKQSQLFVKTQKNVAAEEVSKNAKFLMQGGYVDKLMAGVYTMLPLGLRAIKNIERIIREEMNQAGGQEIVMPALHPKENWATTGRWDTVDDLFKVEVDEKEFALGPTHEEVVVPLAKRFISSYKDLPVYLYQFQDKFRNEKRAKSGVLRGREFLMKDFYSFHADEADLDAYYEKFKAVYAKIFSRLGLGEKTYLTYASGGTFSKYSHEFQTLTEAGEDLIYICDKCRVAVNREILADLDSSCPLCGNKGLREEKAVEVGNIFKLMDKFTTPFDLKYKDKDGTDKIVLMGCYGIGLPRNLGTIVEVLSDGKSIVWPEEVAPFKYHIIPLKGKTVDTQAAAAKIYEELLAAGAEVLFDDRDLSAGEKFADADFVGAPYRLVVSEKTLAEDSVEVNKRAAGEVKLVKAAELLGEIGK